MQAAAGSGSISPLMVGSTPRVWLASAFLLGGCAREPSVPVAPSADLATAVARAIDAEARDDAAWEPWVDALARAASAPEAPASVGVAAAALDALVHRSAPTDPLVFRRREAFSRSVLRMREIWEGIDPASGPYAPLVAGLVARSMHALALHTGEARGAGVWADRRGCLRAALAVGPTDAAPLGALERPSAIPGRGALPAAFVGLAPFTPQASAALVRADACALDTRASGGARGLREAVVDLEIGSARELTFALSSSGPAVLEVAGQRAIVRDADAGEGGILRFARVRVSEGRLRVVVRLADRGGGAGFELDVLDEAGRLVPATVPSAGDVANATAEVIERIDPSTWARALGGTGGAQDPDRDAAIALVAAAELALGEERAAFRRLDAEVGTGASRGGAPTAETTAARTPALYLLYQRALEDADEVSDSRRSERSRDAARRVLAAWPDAWEARLAEARLTGERRGPDEGPFAALSRLGLDLAGDSTEGLAALSPPELAYVADVAEDARLFDLSARAFAALAAAAPGSTMLARVDADLHERTGPEAIQAACAGGLSRATTGCLAVKRANGDLDGALDEIERLRRLRDAPTSLREVELGLRIEKGDLAGVLAVYDDLPVAQRPMLPALGFAAARGDAAGARSRLARDGARAGDAPQALPLLAQLLEGGSPLAKRLEAEGLALVQADRLAPAMPGAATAVLRRVEHYGLDPDGLLTFVVYDLRRVGGTTDVDQNAATALPVVEGRGTSRLLRRRVHKKDGRVLHPEGAAMASQGNTDLSQLETGDYVEQIVEGHYLPNDQGHLVLDTPDLLPDRTSVRGAEIVIRHPAKLPLRLWSHPRLGAPAKEERAGYTFLTFRLTDAPPRRLEEDVPALERGIRVSLGTLGWEDVAQNVAEAVRAMDARDPFVERFAREAAGLREGQRATQDRATIGKIVDRVGEAIKEPRAYELTDMGSMGASSSIRAAVEDREGSRTWIVARSLRALGFDAEIAVAEPEPFSASPDVPPHTGRFRHPLVVVRLPDGEVWIDADLPGAPLPPGEVSPELRGRSALLASGRVVAVQGASESAGDEVDLKLVVDEKGNAKGTLAIVVRGRPAQALTDAFQQVVGSERKQMLRSVVLGWLPWADVDDVTMATEGGAWQVALRAEVSVSGFARPEGKDGAIWVLPGVEPVHYVFPRPFATTLGTSYTAQRERSTALSIENPLQFRMRRRIELPATARVEHRPGDVTVEGGALRATRKVVVDGQVLTEEYRLDLPTGTVAPAAYARFVADVQAIDSGFLAGTRVRAR